MSGHAIANQRDVLRRADKGDCNGVDAVIESELEIERVFLSERGRAHEDAREVDAFAFAEHAAVDDIANDIVAENLMNAQFDEAVGEQNARALFHIFSQRLEGGSDCRSSSRYVARRDREFVAALEQHRLMILKQPGTDLRSL